MTDWIQFWQHFEKTIDKCKNYAAITKFIYLRELLTNQARTEI